MPKRRPKRPSRIAERAVSPVDLGQAVQEAVQAHREGKLAQAERAYGRLLAKQPDLFVVHHLLGRLLYSTGRQQAGIEALRQALQHRPEYPEALLDLANMLSETGQLSAAEECLRKLIRLQPAQAMAHNNLGVILKEQAAYEAAVSAFQRALELDPANAETLCNLAYVHLRLGAEERAVDLLRQALQCDPQCSQAHRSLTALLRRQGDHQAAYEALLAWRQVDPHNPVLKHLVAAYEQTVTPPRASDGYVRQVFDDFAATFDQDLQRLDYRGPRLMELALQRAYPPGSQLSTVLDAGCGTGLCGAVIRRYASHLTGVDLSHNMLAVARQRTLYDELVEAELMSFLHVRPAAFDLIVCADTLGYFGDLMEVLSAAKGALRGPGKLVATVELGTAQRDPGYTLYASGRYAHHPDYVKECCQTVGLQIEQQVEETLRREANQDVRALLLTAAVAD